MFGRRTFLKNCILLFVAASSLCGVAQSMGQLTAFRFLQGIGGGGTMTLSQTVIADVVTPQERMRYQGFFTGAFSFLSVAGPLIGGGLNPARAGFMLLSSIFGGRLSSDTGRRKLFMAGGIALGATGLSLLALLAVNQAGIPWLLRALAVLGLGMASPCPTPPPSCRTRCRAPGPASPPRACPSSARSASRSRAG